MEETKKQASNIDEEGNVHLGMSPIEGSMHLVENPNQHCRFLLREVFHDFVLF